jgi:hypothetical protein
MIIRLLLALVLALVVALGWALATGAGGPTPTATPLRVSARSVPESRVYMLMPDGRVEISDGAGRRAFRWDGRRWLEVGKTGRSD